MQIQTPAKINLSLAVLGKRQDGYHRLETLVGFVDFYDHLHLKPAKQSRLQVRGDSPTETPEQNLAYKALQALQKYNAGHYAITLEKHIYCRAGLGGGSSNAAGVLRVLRPKIPGELSNETLSKIALSLGADVPMCLHRRPLRARGVGEEIDFLADYPIRHLVLLAPKGGLDTASVFAQGNFSASRQTRSPANPDDPTSWYNDLEPAACQLYPELRLVLEVLRALPNTVMAGMSGSGTCCFAAFANREDQEEALGRLSQRFPDTRLRAVRLLGTNDV